MSYAKKVDSTHGPIRDGLRQAGMVVFDTSGSNHTRGGRGNPDLVCFNPRRKFWTALWIKRPKGKRTATEQAMDRLGLPITYVETIEQAFQAVGIP